MGRGGKRSDGLLGVSDGSMNDGMNNVPATRERLMGLHAWHECVDDEEEEGSIDLGIPRGLRGATVGFSFGPSFFFVPRGGFWHV